jgi:hypothetical protein
VNSLEWSSSAEHCDRVLPGPFVRRLCLLSDMETLQSVNLKQVGTRFLKVVEFKPGTQRARTCLFTTADANYDLRGNGHNIDIVAPYKIALSREAKISQIESEPRHRR